MDLPFELFVALRYLLARRKQAFISLISLISVLGVMVGVMALLIALALMTGLQGELRDRIVGSAAHVYVQKAGGITDPDAEVRKLLTVPRVIGAAPIVLGKALLTSDGGGEAFIEVKGIVPALEKTVTQIEQAMLTGSLDALDTAPGDDARRFSSGRISPTKLHVSVGDTVAADHAGRHADAVRPDACARGRSRWRARSASGCSSTTRATASSISTSPSARSGATRRTSSSCGSTTCSPRRRSPTSIPERLGSEYMAQDWAD